MDKRVLAVISMHTLSSMESTPSVHVLPMIAATVRWTTCEGGGCGLDISTTSRKPTYIKSNEHVHKHEDNARNDHLWRSRQSV